ncbi:Hypothetical protein MVR_LOCUS173 [uncultured virus]|nr:Hypothetical protein MVR_LOCUS173 [uncultured virus]
MPSEGILEEDLSHARVRASSPGDIGYFEVRRAVKPGCPTNRGLQGLYWEVMGVLTVKDKLGIDDDLLAGEGRG